MKTCPHCGCPLLEASSSLVWTEDDFKSVAHLLPPTALELCTLVGFKTAFRIMQDFGGQQLAIGKNKNKNGKRLFNQLVEKVGQHAAEKLTAAFGSMRLFSVPKCKTAVAELKHRKIRQRFDEVAAQMPYQDALNTVAAEFFVSSSWAVKILKNADIDGEEMPVFESKKQVFRQPEHLPRQQDFFSD